jgi:hypothetical protein
MWPALLLLYAAVGNPSPIDRAFQRLYNFDFAGAESRLDAHLVNKRDDGLAYSVRAAALLFRELDRLHILESEFFAEDQRIIEKKKLKPDAETRAWFDDALEQAEANAQRLLASKPGDPNALFTLSLSSGLRADYTAFIDKRQLQSLASIRQSQNWSLQLLKSNPDFADAELTGGACEYLLGSMPFFVRWFVRFEGVEGQKSEATRKLERVAKSGRYLGPFAGILLAIVNLREKRPEQALSILKQLARDFPENRLFQREVVKVAALARTD